eukprot:g4208.t1
MNFNGRVAIVTGAGNGIGRVYAKMLAARGAKVVVNDLGGSFRGDGASAKAADAVVEEIRSAGGEAVGNYDSVVEGEKVVQTALDMWGRVDLLINNAGILRDTSFAKMGEKDFDLVAAVHLKGAFAMCKAAWPHMREQKYGRIVNITSSAGIYGNFGQANYSAAKLGVLGLSNTLALEGASRNIHVNTIAPFAASRMTETVMPPEMLQQLKPEAVAPFVLYLLHESTTETGSVFECGSGWMAKLRWQRAAGGFFPTEGLTPEKVRDGWKHVVDFDDAAQYPDSAMHALGPIMENISSNSKL